MKRTIRAVGAARFARRCWEHGLTVSATAMI